MATRKPMSARAVALKHGFRSGLEETVSNALKEAGVPFTYEKTKIATLNLLQSISTQRTLNLTMESSLKPKAGS